MALVKLELTEDMLKLISNIRFKEKDEEEGTLEIDINNLYGGSFLYEDVSMILGRYDEHIEGTEDGYDGPRFPKEFEAYMDELHGKIVDNIEAIESIVHMYGCRGGVKPGLYVGHDYDCIFEYIGPVD